MEGAHGAQANRAPRGLPDRCRGLAHAFHHAHARRVRVEIRFDERQFRLRVADDGRGIDERVIHRQPLDGHFGLHGMRERAEGVGGHLDIWSKLDTGTQLDLSIPASAAYGAVPRRLSWFRLRSAYTFRPTIGWTYER